MDRPGFTLVELLVVLAVGAILLVIAIPGHAFLANTNRLAVATNQPSRYDIAACANRGNQACYPSNGL